MRKDVRQVTVKAVVDTVVINLCLNKAVCEELGLDIEGTRMARVADGRQVESKITSPVEVCWKDRSTACHALIVPDAKNIILGTIPLAGLDLMVDPTHRCLVGVHGDEILYELD